MIQFLSLYLKKAKTSDSEILAFHYVPERIRTAGLPLRRRTLYPAELQKHRSVAKGNSCIILKNSYFILLNYGNVLNYFNSIYYKSLLFYIVNFS